MYIVCLIFGFVFISGGLLFLTPNSLELIPGWKKTTKEEKSSLNLKALRLNIALIVGSVGVIFMLCGAFPAVLEGYFRWLMLGWMSVCCVNIYLLERHELHRINRKK